MHFTAPTAKTKGALMAIFINAPPFFLYFCDIMRKLPAAKTKMDYKICFNMVLIPEG